MQQLIGECPVCQGELIVTRTECLDCATSLNGRFEIGPFGHLPPEQITFIELFVRNEGKINRMEADLGLSYPTIRNKLHEVIRALGYQPGDDFSLDSTQTGLSQQERNKILDDLEKGLISYDEAMLRLKHNEV